MKKKLFILSVFVLLMTALTGCGYVAEFGNEPYPENGIPQDYYRQSLYFTEGEMPGMFEKLKKVGLDFGHTSLNNLLCGLVCDGSVRDVKKSEIINGKDYHMFSPFYFDVAYQPKMKINAVEGKDSSEGYYTYFEFSYSDYEYLWKRDGINVKTSDMDFAKVKFNKITDLKYLVRGYDGVDYTYKEYAKKCGIDIKDYMEHNGTYDEKTDTVTWDLQKMNGEKLYLKIDIIKLDDVFRKYFNSKDNDSEDDKGDEDDDGGSNNNKKPKYKSKDEAQKIVNNNIVNDVKVKYIYSSGRKIQVNWSKNNNLDGYKVVAFFGKGNTVYKEVGKDTTSVKINCPDGKSSASIKILGYKKYQDKNGNVTKCYTSTSKASKITPAAINFPKKDNGKCKHSFTKSDDKYYSSYTIYKCKKKNCNVSYKCKRAKTKITFKASRKKTNKKNIKISLVSKPSKVSYYQIRYSTKKSKLTGKTKTGTLKKVKPSKMPYTIKKINTKKDCYIIVRPVRVKNGKALYGSWSKVVQVNKVNTKKKK